MFMVLLLWPKSSWEFTRLIVWMQTECLVAANPQSKPINLGCESAENWPLPSTCTFANIWKILDISKIATINKSPFTLNFNRGVYTNKANSI